MGRLVRFTAVSAWHERAHPPRITYMSMKVSLTSAIRVLQQARALGAHFSQIRFAVIHASDLKRAFSTAEALCAAQPTPAPPLAASALFREQSFGLAEGTSISWTRSWDDLTSDMPSSGRKVHFRSEKFPNGESLDELAKRAEQAIQEIILPYAWEAARTGFHGAHVVVVSHGLFLSEIMAALLKKDALGRGQHMTFRGHKNTAWSRVTIDVKVCLSFCCNRSTESPNQGAKPGIRLESPENEPILVHLTHFNQWDHLLTVVSPSHLSIIG
jgi:broad specificity phosphatase PhoE